MKREVSITLTKKEDGLLKRFIRAELVMSKKEFGREAIKLHFERGEELLKRIE